ncbi:hypothetical protein RJG79_00030 [Mycoplasmatota bacterium WC44]
MFKLMKYIMIFICLYTFHTVFETYLINKQLDDFKNMAVYDYSEGNINYYIVESNVSSNNTGDILLSRKSGNPNLLLRDMISFYVGGHAAVIINEEETIEVFGNLQSENLVRIYENDWLDTETEVIGMKVEGNYEFNFTKYLNQTYNWFPFYDNPNKRYCTDLVSKIYSEAGINVNYDLGIVTVNDIIISKNTSIYLYKEIVKDEINIYYKG